MKLTEDELIRILKLVEQSTFDELHLETGELKLVVRKQGCGTIPEESNAPPANLSPLEVAPVKKVEKRLSEPAVSKGKQAKAATEQDGLIPIKAPLLGTVYRRPSPDAPPYVEKGSFVKENDTVCLIEVMKVFTAVKAGVRGRVTDVLIETNEMVEHGQPLFMVKPEAGPA